MSAVEENLVQYYCMACTLTLLINKTHNMSIVISGLQEHSDVVCLFLNMDVCCCLCVCGCGQVSCSVGDGAG